MTVVPVPSCSCAVLRAAHGGAGANELLQPLGQFQLWHHLHLPLSGGPVTQWLGGSSLWTRRPVVSGQAHLRWYISYIFRNQEDVENNQIRARLCISGRGLAFHHGVFPVFDKCFTMNQAFTEQRGSEAVALCGQSALLLQSSDVRNESSGCFIVWGGTTS